MIAIVILIPSPLRFLLRKEGEDVSDPVPRKCSHPYTKACFQLYLAKARFQLYLAKDKVERGC